MSNDSKKLLALAGFVIVYGTISFSVSWVLSQAMHWSAVRNYDLLVIAIFIAGLVWCGCVIAVYVAMVKAVWREWFQNEKEENSGRSL